MKGIDVAATAREIPTTPTAQAVQNNLKEEGVLKNTPTEQSQGRQTALERVPEQASGHLLNTIA